MKMLSAARIRLFDVSTATAGVRQDRKFARQVSSSRAKDVSGTIRIHMKVEGAKRVTRKPFMEAQA